MSNGAIDEPCPDHGSGSDGPLGDQANTPQRPARGGYVPASYGFPQPATYGQRVGGFLIDIGIPAGVLVIVVMVALSSGDAAVLVTVGVLATLVALAFVLYNSGYRQGATGQSIGKRALQVRLVAAAAGQPVGFGAAVGRQIAHVLDALPLGVGFLWPLWDAHGQTFADKMCSTLVVQTDL